MKRFGLFLILVLAAVIPTFAQKTLVVGTTEEGKIKNTSAAYTFTATAQQIIVFTLTSADFDPFLQIDSASGDMLASDDDGGDGLNSRIVFVAPEAGDYTLTVRSYSGNATGSYVLDSTDDIAQLAFGESVEVSLLEGSTVQSYFMAEANDVITLSAVAVDTTVDTNLTLVGPDGVQVDFSEDANGLNPTITRAILPLSGMYAVTLAPYGSDDFGKVTLLLEKTALPMLSADALNLKFAEGYSTEILGFNTEQGVLYTITITFDKEASASVEIQGADYSSYGYLNFTAAETVSYAYRAKETGLMRVKVTNNGYDFPVGYTVTAMPFSQ